MWKGVKAFWTTDRLITWGIMPLAIATGLFVGFKLYKFSNLQISDTVHRHGTIESIEKDFTGYEKRVRYRIKLKEFRDVFYIVNVLTNKVDNLELISADKVSDIYFIRNQNENDIVSMQLGSYKILSIKRFNEHYKSMMTINLIGTSIFFMWFGFRVCSKERIRHESY